MHEAHADADGDERHRQGGQQFQREGGEEGQPQGPQRGPPVVGGDRADRLGLGLGPAEDLQRGQALDDVEEVPGEPGQQPPLPVHPALGGPADQGHEEGDEGKREDDDECREPVGGDDTGEDGDGHHDREAQLGQVAGEVVVERVDPARGEGGQLARGAGAGAEAGGVGEQSRPQLGLDRRARAVGGELGEPGHRRPTEGDGGQQRQRRGEFAGRASVLEGAGDDLRDQHRLGHDQAGARQPEGDRGAQEEAGRGGVPQQPGVDGLHDRVARVSGRPGCAGCRSACGTPSRSRPGSP